MNRRDIMVASTMTAVGLALPARSLAQTSSAKEKIVGAWSLDSIYDEGADGAKHYVWGDGVQGLAIYTAGGHFSSQVIAANRDKDASKNPRMPVPEIDFSIREIASLSSCVATAGSRIPFSMQ